MGAFLGLFFSSAFFVVAPLPPPASPSVTSCRTPLGRHMGLGHAARGNLCQRGLVGLRRAEMFPPS